MSATRQPWLKFYASDWRSDQAVHSCSLAARGLWIDMLCLMFEADGSLRINNKPIGSKQLAQLVGVTQKECDALLNELSEFGVFSVDGDGAIYSRRMRRDITKAKKDKANGSSGGNPNLRKEDNPGVNPPLNPNSNRGDKRGDKAQKPEARVFPSQGVETGELGRAGQPADPGWDENDPFGHGEAA